MSKSFSVIGRSLLVLIALICLGVGTVPVVNAAEYDSFLELLDEGYDRGIVYEETTSKKKIKAIESPASIKVITKEDIENSWATNIPDLLRDVVGVDVLAVYAGTHMIGIRGASAFSSSRVGILIDGQVIEPFVYGTNPWNQVPVTLQDIRRIEVVRSPGGVLYGANASFGVVNILTDLPTEEAKTTISAGYEEAFEQTSLAVTTAGKSGGFGYRIGASYFDAARDYPHESNGEKVDDYFDRTADEHTIISGLFTYEPDMGSTKWTLAFANNEYDYWNRLPDRLCESLNDGYNRFAKIAFEKELKEGTDIEVSLKYDATDYRQTWNRGGPPWDPYLYPEFEKSITTLDVEYSSQVNDNNFIVVGIQGKLEEVDDYGVNKWFYDDISENLYSIYAIDQYTIADGITLHFGARVSDHYVTDTSVSPYAALVAAIDEKNVVRFTYNKAVREPNIYETGMDFTLTGGNPGKIGHYVGLTDVDVETNNAYEVAYIYSGEKIDFETVLFYYDGEDYFDHDQVGVEYPVDAQSGMVVEVPRYEFNNYSDEALTYGVEISLIYTASKDLELFVNGTYQNVENDSHAVGFPDGRFGENYAPEYKFNMGFDYTPFEWLQTAVSVNYVDEVEWIRGVFDHDIDDEVLLLPQQDAYTIVNWNISYMPTKNTRISLKVYNLFDEEHMEWPSLGSSFIPRKTMIDAKVTF